MTPDQGIVEFRGEQGRLVIHIRGYENPGAEHPSDANWLSVRLEADVDGFAADTAAALTTQDLAELREGLSALLSGQTSDFTLQVDERQIELRIALNRTGHVMLSGVIAVVGPPTAKLEFTLRADQSSLRESLAHVVRECERHPIRGA